MWRTHCRCRVDWTQAVVCGGDPVRVEIRKLLEEVFSNRQVAVMKIESFLRLISTLFITLVLNKVFIKC